MVVVEEGCCSHMVLLEVMDSNCSEEVAHTLAEDTLHRSLAAGRAVGRVVAVSRIVVVVVSTTEGEEEEDDHSLVVVGG